MLISTYTLINFKDKFHYTRLFRLHVYLVHKSMRHFLMILTVIGENLSAIAQGKYEVQNIEKDIL